MQLSLENTIEAAELTRLLAVMVTAYLAGSINFSILLFRLMGWPDPRTRFSGNPGTTNVYRQAGWPAAAAVLLLDMGRAGAVALLARALTSPSLEPWAALALIAGNHWPCLHGFKGGKGVANFLGFYAVLLPLGALAGVSTYVAVFAASRIAFIASFGMVAAISAFGILRWWPDPASLSGLALTVAAIIWFHRENISKLALPRKPSD